VEPNELKVAFGNVIRELRLSAGISQEVLSLQCGRHRTYVSLIERGKNAPSILTLWVLAESLDVSPSDVIARVEARLASSRRAVRRKP
jgi:transcriptional regulator with XRE-family HTH domain